ncbi:HAD family hydrolase [Spiribacter halobius]|uniref:Histidinol-phosphatase n=1 Tax=Sediminicurvatus halobius TaxID=2182432 RepID=A0A2U2MVZ9_9GAMM|nr:HAD family hydrolase [Spiribacter halobius]PWG61029.1 HAD-IB family hydrolase [Spiribacter halobius]UEX77418.1 HAD-IB family hydrolase [Spiribacter halobius]
MRLAIFDLDNTLLGGDSDHLWGRFLAELGVVDGERYERANERYLREYERGELDIDEFLAFALRPLAENAPEDLEAWRRRFVEERIRPLVLPAARQLVETHRARGDVPLIITATNRFVTEPIAALFGIEELLATEPEHANGRYTGRHRGTPTFREGKIHALEAWLAERDEPLEASTFYSDSRNDLPLLERVDRPVAVDPDPVLAETARHRGWPRITLRAGIDPQPLD